MVWDEVLAFWIVLWLVMPAGLAAQAAAFALFRFFDAASNPSLLSSQGLLGSARHHSPLVRHLLEAPQTGRRYPVVLPARSER